MPYKLISDCPVCNSKLNASKLTCTTCGTIIENDFELSKFELFNKEQLRFIEIFLKCRGSIKEVEKELGVSYPTVRAKLDDVIKAMGYDVEEESNKEMSNIIDKLEKGEIDSDEALKRIKE
jgi:hypothetical protein